MVFAKKRSTLNPLLRLSNQIQQGFALKRQTIGVFFDLEKAYDTTWRKGILRELCRIGIKGSMLNFLWKFLSDRYIKVKVGDKISSAFKQEEGVLQGSILSVTLFSIAINNITRNVSAPVNCSLFVDDFAVYCTSYDATSACKYIQKSINEIGNWADNNGFKFSTSKTIAVRFSRTRRKEEIPTLMLKGNIIPYEDQVKFLGLIFDKGLTWGPHIDFLKIKVKKSLNILKVISSYDWGADRRSLLRVYDSLCRSKLEYACQIYSSACNSKLKELDAVHNLGLRICTGAFRTSPVESIYIDSDELPLDLRRQELGLRYIQRLKNNPQNPAYKVFSSCNSRAFDKPRSSKPFQVRINEEIQDEAIKKQKINEVGCSAYPPWLMPQVQICPKTIIKKKSSTEECRYKFLQHNSHVHRNHTKVFTDGSKTSNGVGSAVFIDNTIHQSRLSNCASVFTAEMTAIINALSLINKRSELEFVIFSDSYSSIKAIEQFNPSHPLVQIAQEWIYKLHTKYTTVHFCWIPSHVGIRKNEIVDAAAKEATLNQNIDIKRIPHIDMKGPIKRVIMDKWQNRWSSSSLPNNKKYKKIRPAVGRWSSACHPNRRFEKILTRLRVGHTRLTHKFLLEGSRPPVCDECHVLLTVEHILVECTKFRAARLRYGLQSNIKILLDDNADIVNVMEFLKEIGLFYEI